MENENNVQSVINKVASTIDPQDNTDEDLQNQNGDQGAGDGSGANDDSNPDTGQEQTEEEKKQHQALAAMRVSNKEKDNIIAQLKADIEALKNPSKQQEETKPDPLAVKDTDSEEVKLLKAELAEIKQGLQGVNKTQEEQAKKERDARLYSEIAQVQKEYSLDRDALIKFADDAQAAGLVIGQSNLSVSQIYKVVYHDQLMAQAAKNVENAANQAAAPGSGPSGGSGAKSGVTGKSMNEVLAKIAKEQGLTK